MFPLRFRGLQGLRSDLAFLAGYFLSFLLFQQALRLLLWARNLPLAEDISAADMARAFLVGLRFDLIVASLVALPLVIALFLPRGLGLRRWTHAWLGTAAALVFFLGVVEPEFYHEFHARLNSIAIQYLKEDPAVVTSMIWHGFQVVRYLLLWLVLTFAFAWMLPVPDDRLFRGDTYPVLRVTTPALPESTVPATCSNRDGELLGPLRRAVRDREPRFHRSHLGRLGSGYVRPSPTRCPNPCRWNRSPARENWTSISPPCAPCWRTAPACRRINRAKGRVPSGKGIHPHRRRDDTARGRPPPPAAPAPPPGATAAAAREGCPALGRAV